MFSRLMIALGFLLLISSMLSFGVQAMAPISIMNATDTRLEIIPLEQAQQSGLTVPNNLATQPPGSFILRNRMATAITVAVVEWVYVQKDGNRIKRGINCDGYGFGPVWVIVKPQDFSLITPKGCTQSGSLSANFADHTALNEPIPPVASLAHVDLTLDSVIFENGQIWGPDRQKYYKKIWERYNAAHSVATEITTAKNAGEDIGPRLAKIRDEAHASGDRQSSWKEHYAGLLQRSPNPEGTLRQLQEQLPPPEFRHIGGEKQ